MIGAPETMTKGLVNTTVTATLLACVLAIRDQVAPPTINLDNPAVTPKLDLAPNKAVKRKIDVALSNSFGFGGTNASVIIKAID